MSIDHNAVVPRADIASTESPCYSTQMYIGAKSSCLNDAAKGWVRGLKPSRTVSRDRAFNLESRKFTYGSYLEFSYCRIIQCLSSSRAPRRRRPSSETRSPDWVSTAVLAGRKGFHHIIVPALYICAEDNIPANYDKTNPETRTNAEAYIANQHDWIQRRTEHFTTDAPNGRLVILQGASHFVFVSNPQEVCEKV
jgi:hypothetical protein